MVRLIVCLALVGAACTDARPRADADARPAAAGEEHEEEMPATGKPLVFGMYNQEHSLLGSFSDLRIAAEVAAIVVNEDRGGIGGRPIRIERCATDGTARAAVDCARRLVAKRPLAVFGGVDIAAAAALPVYERAGLPVIGIPSAPEEYEAPTAFRFSGAAAAAFSALPSTRRTL